MSFLERRPDLEDTRKDKVNIKRHSRLSFVDNSGKLFQWRFRGEFLGLGRCVTTDSSVGGAREGARPRCGVLKRGPFLLVPSHKTSWTSDSFHQVELYLMPDEEMVRQLHCHKIIDPL